MFADVTTHVCARTRAPRLQRLHVVLLHHQISDAEAHERLVHQLGMIVVVDHVPLQKAREARLRGQIAHVNADSRAVMVVVHRADVLVQPPDGFTIRVVVPRCQRHEDRGRHVAPHVDGHHDERECHAPAAVRSGRAVFAGICHPLGAAHLSLALSSCC